MNKPVSKTLMVFLPLLIFCTIVRYLQLVYAVDFNTGFYRNDAGLLAILLYVAFAAGLVLLSAAALWERKCRGEFFVKKLGRIDESDVRLTGVMFFLGVGAVLYALVTGYFEGLGLLAAFFGIIGYTPVGCVMFIKKRVNTVVGFLMIFPALYFTLRMIMLFMSNLVLTRMSDYLIRILICIFSVVFFLAAGRVFSRNENKSTRIRLAVTGYSALGLSLSETVSKFVYRLTVPSSVQQDLSLPGRVFIMPTALDMAECIIIFSLLMLMLRYPASAERKE